MIKNTKNSFEYKIIGTILYFLLSLGGISLILLFSPRNLLFDVNSKEQKIKLNLYKNFAKTIYEIIQTPLIKNLTLTEDGKECPDNFETLKTKNQYYGNFTKFYGNKSLCIERLKDNDFSFKNLLKNVTYSGDIYSKKECGELIENSKLFIYVNKENKCPLNDIEFNTKSRVNNFGNYSYKIGPGDHYIIPIFGKNPKYPVIVNIEIINNYKICLEKHINAKDLPCEFPDNNECFIEDNYKEIFSLEHGEQYKLNPVNLARWNLANNDNINHNYCKDNLNFHIFAHGYINFTETNLYEFEKEFPPMDYTNNSLYKYYIVYKSPKNIDNFFYLISYNLFIWSLIHFILQTMLYLNKKNIRKIYINNGIVLFFFKLLSLLGMIIYYYCFYLKIEKIYLVMIDKPRNKVLEYYSKDRSFFIIRIVLISLIGFTIICIDLIIYIFSLTIQWGVEFKILEKEIKNISKEIPQKNVDNHIILDDNPISFEEPNFSNNPKIKEIKTQNINNDNKNDLQKTEVPKNKKSNNYSNEIKLIFICKENFTKSYEINIGKDEYFKETEAKLKEKYSELKRRDMKIFTYDSNIINKEKTIHENGLSNNMKILII